MIPKVIHYCWFGRNPLPASAKKCIASWRKFLPDYEIKEWNEDNFDVNIIPYTTEAYRMKKYAFVSDYARFWILYKFGGIYFDTDVEVIRPIDDIIDRGPFMGCERAYDLSKDIGATTLGVAPGLGLGVNPGLGLYKKVLDKYDKMEFEIRNVDTVVTIVSKILEEEGLKYVDGIQEVAGVYIYPKEYFCPKDYETNDLTITENSRSIHHYSATWLPWYVKLKLFIMQKILGKKIVALCRRIKHCIK